MPDDEDREAILSRRNRLVAIALSGLASASTGCYEAHVPGGTPPRMDGGTLVDSGGPTVCLRVDAGYDAAVIIGPCLSSPEGDAAPDPCLGVAIDAGPMPCLDIAPEDAGPTRRRPPASRWGEHQGSSSSSIHIGEWSEVSTSRSTAPSITRKPRSNA